MDDSDLITSIRYSAFISDSDPEYTDARLRIEAWNMLMTSFADSMVRSRQGYWRQEQLTTLVSGQRNYRIPARALVSTIDLVEVLQGSDYRKLHAAEIRDVGGLESKSGDPVWYIVENDTIKLFPTPTAAGTMRIKYAVRPSQLVQEQTAGLITAVDTSARTLTMAARPVVRATAASLAAADLADVVHAGGCYDLGVCNATVSGVTGAGPYVYTFAAGTDLSRVAVGDYLRAAGETDWPQIPTEFHRTLADATAAAILVHKGATAKAQVLASKVGSELERMRSIIEPRAKFDPAVLRRRNTLLRRRPWPRFPVAPQ